VIVIEYVLTSESAVVLITDVQAWHSDTSVSADQSLDCG
jgi:hypothetical protein